MLLLPQKILYYMKMLTPKARFFWPYPEQLAVDRRPAFDQPNVTSLPIGLVGEQDKGGLKIQHQSVLSES